MRRNILRNKKAMSIVISTIIIAAIAITMAIAVSFWAMGISNAFTRFEKLEIISGYVADTTTNNDPINYPPGWRPPGANQSLNCYVIWLSIKNTGTNTATINSVFLDGKPYNTRYSTSRVPGGILAYQTGLVAVSLQTGVVLGGRIFLPVGGMWNSGDFIALEIETSAGRHYMYTVVLP